MFQTIQFQKLENRSRNWTLPWLIVVYHLKFWKRKSLSGKQIHGKVFVSKSSNVLFDNLDRYVRSHTGKFSLSRNIEIAVQTGPFENWTGTSKNLKLVEEFLKKLIIINVVCEPVHRVYSEFLHVTAKVTVNLIFPLLELTIFNFIKTKVVNGKSTRWGGII